ncbi:hypothetical protein AaE_013200 [Aphanomyces astaci]|uniref:Reverse transcriptase Ty1/copia-type domain-containing protein n=1 Tax=Aphanomyces astaci TaxID=112090 RepID=A0A6A4Z4V1_APHAT|nr:hypothetical protein AaE_013200 [Aphanomyces astaci]
MFANADFAHGRRRVPQSNAIAGITSADDLKSVRFVDPDDTSAPATRTRPASEEPLMKRRKRTIKAPKRCEAQSSCSIIATLDLETFQLDIKTAFLNGELDETIYMKALYGFKQAQRQWHKKLDVFLCTLGFKRCNKDRRIYVLRDDDNAVSAYLVVYVDDITLAGQFATTDKGELDYWTSRFNGTTKRVPCTCTNTFLFKTYLFASTWLAAIRLQLLKYKVSRPLMHPTHATSPTRTDIATAVRYLTLHNHGHTQIHWRLAKRVLNTPLAYNDADFANDNNDSKSITGFVIMLAGVAAVYMSRKQSLVGQSTTEVEFIAAAEAAKSIL